MSHVHGVDGVQGAHGVHGPLRLVVNPTAGARSARTLPTLTGALDALGVTYDVVVTSCPRDAEELTTAALAEGVRFLAAVGGDGTLHGVVNGVVAAGVSDAVVGIVPAGTGSDFARTLGLHLPPERAARHLASAATMPVDVGVATFPEQGGQTRYFINCAQVGYGAEVVRLAARWPRRLGRFRYLFAAWGGMRAVTRQRTRIGLAHAAADVELAELVVANGQFFGAGMRVAPRAVPDDGRFNVLAFTGDRGQVFRLTTAMYQGRHLPDPHIREWQSPVVDVEAGQGFRVEADGELLGHTPVRFRLLERRLTVKI